MDEKFKKHAFTKLYIKPMLKILNESIIEVEYVKATPSNEEYINVYFKSGYRKQVCVTADSLKAMVIDTLKNISC